MKTILVGLDGSQQEQTILAQAVNLAHKLDSRLVLCRAVALPVELPPQAFSMSPDQVEPMLEDVARQGLEKVARSVPADVKCSTRVDLGVPWRTLLAVAKEEKADLLIIGSHGYGGIERLLGTTAAKVVNHADCSVLVVR